MLCLSHLSFVLTLATTRCCCCCCADESVNTVLWYENWLPQFFNFEYLSCELLTFPNLAIIITFFSISISCVCLIGVEIKIDSPPTRLLCRGRCRNRRLRCRSRWSNTRCRRRRCCLCLQPRCARRDGRLDQRPELERAAFQTLSVPPCSFLFRWMAGQNSGDGLLRLFPAVFNPDKHVYGFSAKNITCRVDDSRLSVRIDFENYSCLAGVRRTSAIVGGHGEAILFAVRFGQLGKVCLFRGQVDSKFLR